MKVKYIQTRRAAAAIFLAVASAPTAAPQVAIKPERDHIAISVHGEPFSDFYIGPAYPKPFLAPLRTASGLIVTRKFPMEEVKGETRDHPHHRGLFVGFHDVNGVNFWENEFNYTTNNRGKIVLKHLDDIRSGRRSGRITATFAWVDTKGEAILDEHRTITISGAGDTRTVDVDFTLTAAVDAHFADDKDGFFAIRVADSMTEKNGGEITNSAGASAEKNVWGKRANWVDYTGKVDGKDVGIAMFDSPDNYNHPPRWHVRGYGLFAVNPFMVKDADPKSSDHGGYDLPAGKSMRFRYRVIIYEGDVPAKKIASWYSEYQKKQS